MDRDAHTNQMLEAIAIKRHEVDETTNPSVALVDKITLRNGPKVYKYASHFLILDSHTGLTHHHAIKIETHKRNKEGFVPVDERTIWLDDENDDEIARLATFLCVARNVSESAGDYLIVPIGSDRLKRQAILQVVNAISTSDKAHSIAELLSQMRGDPEL